METNNKTINYENEFSSFPNQKITLHTFKDIDDSVAELINEINNLQIQGKYTQAAIKIQDNSNILSKYIVNAVTFRTWEEEIYNTQTYARQMQQSIYFDQFEPDCLEGDVWIGN